MNAEKKIFLLNGPNLNLLGTRDPVTYGATTLDEIVKRVCEEAKTLGYTVFAFQSNSEGELVDTIQQAGRDALGIIINPGAYTHTSVAIHDALEAVSLPTIEVHLSNIFKRESFRHHSYVSPVASGVICGLGAQGYLLALSALAGLIKR